MIKKIKIKKISLQDDVRLHEIIDNNREQFSRYFPIMMEELNSLESTRYFIEECLIKNQLKQMFPFGIYLDAILIGWINIKNIDFRIMKAEIGYFIGKSFEGKGYMTQAVGEVLEYSFEVVQLNKIILRIGHDNIASKKIATRWGFTLEGILKAEFKIETGAIVDLAYYGLLKSEYK